VWIVRVYVLILRSKAGVLLNERNLVCSGRWQGVSAGGGDGMEDRRRGRRHHFLSLIEPCPSPLLLVSHGLVCVGDVVGRLCGAE
jgi:hypothetical protein